LTLFKNDPLYIKNYSSSHPDLKYHYIAHTAIDVIEERGNFIIPIQIICSRVIFL
jgi:hypothetical protein